MSTVTLAPGSQIQVVNPGVPQKIKYRDPNRFVVNTPGVPGPAGTPGGGGFVWHQATPLSSWNITHTLGRSPLSVMVVVGGNVVFADVTITGTTQVSVVFATAQSGYLYLA